MVWRWLTDGGPWCFTIIDHRWPPLTGGFGGGSSGDTWHSNHWYGRVAAIIGARLGSEPIIGLAENVLDGLVVQAHWRIEEYTACYRLSRRRKRALDSRQHCSQS
ncbi:hypothetical protein Tco_1356740 [Tanacetum coccineum]